MIIIVEGIDRVGKTTLCNRLSTELNIPIYKKERVTTLTPVTQYATIMLNVGDAIGTVDFWSSDCFDGDIIVDRFYWTEYVYTRSERYVGIDRNLLQMVENRIMKHKDKFIIVYVKPTDIKLSSDMHGSDLSYHSELFDTVFNSSKLDIITTNFNELDNAIDTIKSIMKEKK